MRAKIKEKLKKLIASTELSSFSTNYFLFTFQVLPPLTE